jgi:hypothetical protein
MPGSAADVTGFAESFFRFGPYFLVVLLIATGVGLLINSQPAWLDKRKRFWLSVGFFGASAVVSVMALYDWGMQRRNEVVAAAEAEAKQIVTAAQQEAARLRTVSRQENNQWFIRRLQIRLAGADVAVRAVTLPLPAMENFDLVWRISPDDWRLQVFIFGRAPITEIDVPIVYLEVEDPGQQTRTPLPLCVAHAARATMIEIVMPTGPAGQPSQIGPSLRLREGAGMIAPDNCMRPV